jgi:leucyl/phenylalanyl-tRNA--protein transferase
LTSIIGLRMSFVLTPDDLLYGYINGIFPMADSDKSLYWYCPDPRAIIPLDTYESAKSLRPVLNSAVFEIKTDQAFEQVMRECAIGRTDGEGTWISEDIIQAYTELHRLGFAHSVEAYYNGELAGGLYGVSIGGAFFGESMFYRVSNASKVAFHYLISILKTTGFELLDTQFINDNVRRFGAIEIPKSDYMNRLRNAVTKKVRFPDSEKVMQLLPRR